MGKDREISYPLRKSEGTALKDMVLLAPNEKEALFSVCFSRSTCNMLLEVKGSLTKEEVIRNGTLRDVNRKLAVNLGKEKEFSAEDWMRAGIWQLISENELQQFANPTGGVNSTTTCNEEAKYFLKKREQEPNSFSQPKGLSQKETFLLSLDERRIAFDSCYLDLRKHTENEVAGLITKEGVVFNDALRSILEKFAVGLGKDKGLAAWEWLDVGVMKFIPKDILIRWSHLDGETPNGVGMKARYFLKKQEEENKNRAENK
jgi:hypothetical protein